MTPPINTPAGPDLSPMPDGQRAGSVLTRRWVEQRVGPEEAIQGNEFPGNGRGRGLCSASSTGPPVMTRRSRQAPGLLSQMAKGRSRALMGGSR